MQPQTNEYSQDMKNRLKRIEGQIRGVIKMMDEGKDCKDVITQLSAARSAIDRAAGFVVAKNLETCIRVQLDSGESTDDLIQEAVQMLVKSR
ncbi:metal-sensitive transcriptional regulator [Bacillaceae bacterium S4-13-58]